MAQTDVALCAALISGSSPWTQYGTTYDVAVERLSAGMQRDTTTLIAVDDRNTLLGFVWIINRGMFDFSGYIRWIVVDSNQRGNRIGQMLIEAAETHVRQSAREIFLLCSDFNVDARRFYERNGYMQVGALPDLVLPGVVEILYRKRLY
jgi:ribosomal protein S18 acetylase RimI-like enzyme